MSSARNVALAALRARDAACQFETGQAAAAPELFIIPIAAAVLASIRLQGPGEILNLALRHDQEMFKKLAGLPK
jgi:hypothetical protein